MAIEPVTITIVQGTPAWDAFYEAMGQYVENTADFVEIEEFHDGDHALEMRRTLNAAERLLETANAAVARLAECPVGGLEQATKIALAKMAANKV